jgi:hypothetical protein
MSGNPHPVFQDNVPVEKANARAYLPLRLGNPDALRALDGSTFWLVYIQSVVSFFYRDTSDTTSADNGISVIVDGSGGIWKVISSGAGIGIDAAGPLSGRVAFDSEDPGFTYFGTDTELLYIRLSAGGWSSGSQIVGPEGSPGTNGRNFSPDQVVPDIAARAAYDGEAKNFAVLVESDSSNSDLPTLYFKESASSGDWSNGFTFSGGGDVAGETHSATSKTTPANADEFPIVDSEASNVLKKMTWANLKAALALLFATAAQGTKADSAVQLSGTLGAGKVAVGTSTNGIIAAANITDNGTEVTVSAAGARYLSVSDTSGTPVKFVAFAYAAGGYGGLYTSTNHPFRMGTNNVQENMSLDTDKAVTIRPVATVPAGGDNSIGLKFTATANLGIFVGSGAPTLSAAKGSLYIRTDGSSTSTRLYVNTSGSTTWTNVTTAT